jgi:hypothetical protein
MKEDCHLSSLVRMGVASGMKIAQFKADLTPQKEGASHASAIE